MQYTSKILIQSKIHPGVTFTLKKMSHGRRVQFNVATAPIYKEQREALRKQIAIEQSPMFALYDQYIKQAVAWGSNDGSELPVAPEGYEDYLSLTEERQRINDAKLVPALIRWGLLSVEGLKLDGSDSPTPDQVIECAEEEFTKEIADAILEHKGISDELSKNSQSLSTLNGRVQSEAEPTTATRANA